MEAQRLIVGISGASGAIYGIEMLKALAAAGVETHLIISKMAQVTIAHETDYSVGQVQKLASRFYSEHDLSASLASGSFDVAGMIVAPCSMKSLAAIATGHSTTLLSRAADVTLKERRKLVLLTRETPLTLAHIRHMETVTLMGGIIVPPVPAFYNKPQSLQDIVVHTVGRTLDLFQIETAGIKRWQGADAIY